MTSGPNGADRRSAGDWIQAGFAILGDEGLEASAPEITPEFVARSSERAAEAERLRRLPAATLADPATNEFIELLVPARYGGIQASFPAILSPVRRMAHGCASSAWTLGFYALHNWMLALFSEQAQGRHHNAPVPGPCGARRRL